MEEVVSSLTLVQREELVVKLMPVGLKMLGLFEELAIEKYLAFEVYFVQG